MAEMTVKMPELRGDSGAADRVLTALGCSRCQQRRVSTYGRSYAPCIACARMPAWSPGTVEKRESEAGSHVLHVLDKMGWCFTLLELVRYLTEKTRAPWLRISWGGEALPRLAYAGRSKAATRAATNGFGHEQVPPPWDKDSYHIPMWLQVMLDVGTVMRKRGFSVTKAKEGFNWPDVINHFTEHPEERAPLLSVISCSTTTESDVLGSVSIVDPSPIAQFIAGSWPALVTKPPPAAPRRHR